MRAKFMKRGFSGYTSSGLLYSLIYLVAVAISAEDVAFVLPNGFEDKPGNAFTSEAFRNGPDRVEQVYAASQFQAPFGLFITAISVRVDEKETLSYDAVIPGFQIRLSTFSQSLAALSPFHELNRGSDEITVFNGDIHLTGRALGTGQPNPFDLRIPFTTPFSYNPSAGHLLIYMESFGSTLGSQFIDSHDYGLDSSIARQTWHDSFLSVVNQGFIMKFEATLVPEPKSVLLILAGLSLLYLTQRNK
jgi:hypothetical protein